MNTRERVICVKASNGNICLLQARMLSHKIKANCMIALGNNDKEKNSKL